MSVRNAMIEIGRRVGFVVAAVVFWQIAQIAFSLDSGGTRNGEVVIHVAEEDVVLLIDDREYPAPAVFGAPASCALSSGHHILKLRRDGKTLCLQEFEVEAGAHVVLTAWDESHRSDPLPVQPGRNHLVRKSEHHVPDPNRQTQGRFGLE